MDGVDNAKAFNTSMLDGLMVQQVHFGPAAKGTNVARQGRRPIGQLLLLVRLGWIAQCPTAKKEENIENADADRWLTRDGPCCHTPVRRELLFEGKSGAAARTPGQKIRMVAYKMTLEAGQIAKGFIAMRTGSEWRC